MKYVITYINYKNVDNLHMDIISAENATEAIALIEKKHDHEIEWLSLTDADDPFYKINPPKKETINEGWQLCPKCNGDGNLLRFNSPSIISSDVICDLCYGRKIISTNNGLPPVYKTDKS